MSAWKPSWALLTILAAAAALVLLFAILTTAKAHESQVYVGQARVIDGDTLQIQGQSIRLEGIDAPERRWRAGEIATKLLEAFINFDEVSCFTVDTDRYGRRIGECSVRGKDLGFYMLRNGWAIIVKRYGTPPKRVLAERLARHQCLGVWSGDMCNNKTAEGF